MTSARKRMTTRLVAATAASALVATAFAAPARAEIDLGRLSDYVKTVKQQAGASAVPNKWFVQVEGATTSAGGSASVAKQNQKNVLNAAKGKGLKVSMTRSFTTTFNGMTVDVDDASVAELAATPGVVKVFPVVEVQRPVTNAATARPDMATAISLTGANVAQNELGLTGKGIKIGVIDTGIDYDHPDFGGNGTPNSTRFPTAKVAFGYDFVGDAYDASKDGSRPVPDADPDDCEGHGTHVAGIAAADGNTAKQGTRGVAPKATLGAYRVFGCTGSSDSDIIMAAMEKSAEDRMDVVNMSLGFSFMTWPSYPTAQATDALTRKGVIVVTSAGNSGEDGMFSGGAPGVSPSALSVASFDNSHITQNAFKTSNGMTIGYGAATGAPTPPASGTLAVKPVAAPGTPAQGCAPLAPVAPGTALMIQRGGCSFYEKALAAQNAGAAALIMYNNAPGVINPTVEGDVPITIPVVMISQADGTALATAALAGEVTMTWGDFTLTTKDPAGGLVSEFSSWGLAADLTTKPDLGAPGGNIWAPIPLEKGGHGSKSGTSMASPHVAGLVALMLEARPELKGKTTLVRELLQNTADPALFSFDPGSGLPDLVIRQGAGLADVVQAITSKQSVSPGKITLGEQARKPKTTTLEIKNTAKVPVTYTISNLDGVGAAQPSDPQFDLLPATFRAPKTVTVKAGGKAKVDVTISQPADAPDGYVYGGWVVLEGDNGSTLRVPYTGMAGDYQSLQAIQDIGAGFPWLAKVEGEDDISKVGAGHNFSMQGQDVPFVVFHLEYPVSDLQLWVYTANADGSKGALLSTQPVVRTGEQGRDQEVTTLAWDGTYVVGKKKKKATEVHAPAGNYIIELRALKALGDAKNPAHWETWNSPVFSIGQGTADPNLTTIQTDADRKLKR